MQCQSCDKPAVVHLTEIVKGEKIERHLCEACAQKEGIALTTAVPLADFLMKNVVKAKKQADQLSDLSCPECRLTWSEFRRKGLLGCPHDYQAFAEPLKALIHRAQEGHDHHVGRVPPGCEQRLGRQAKLLNLQKQLRQAVAQEDYETAARLRDEIRQFSH